MRLRFVLEQTRQGKDDELADILAARDMVIARYQPVFSPEHLPELTADEFKSFLSFTNNRHWSSIGRHATRLTSDMAALRRTLLVLVDESRPVGRRVTDVLARNGAAKIPGLGKAVATPILLLGNPEKYGVWNDPAEKGMRLLGIWPADESMTEGEKYERIVALLQRLCHDLSVDLWTLDALWWRVVSLGIEKIYSVEEFESALRTLEDLDASDPLDVSRQVAARVEQGFVRQQLFARQAVADCTLCGHQFPIELLRAAHIKRRADCSHEERLDYQHNVMPLCTLGCDELFERGYIVVRHGHVDRGKRTALTPAVADYISRIVDRACPRYYRSQSYFDYHADGASTDDPLDLAGEPS